MVTFCVECICISDATLSAPKPWTESVYESLQSPGGNGLRKVNQPCAQERQVPGLGLGRKVFSDTVI